MAATIGHGSCDPREARVWAVPEHLFVCGVGRSGTTALTTMLSGHRDIALGVERFKALWRVRSRIAELTPDLFEADRFFDFSDDLTNIVPGLSNWGDYYDRLRAKYAGARYVGEKMTEIFVDDVVQQFPHAKFVIIVRDLPAMAHSWDVRAKNADDRGWGANRNANAAVGAWNRGLQRTSDALERYPDQVSVLEYQRLFADPGASSLRALVSRLGLEWEDGIARAFASAHQHHQEKVSGKPRPLDAEIVSVIFDQARIGLWRQVSRNAL
jgi:hypothetical protein